ncbi:MAG: hypothetical protein J6K99_08320 [Peptococcaceae bacterium]|nr:hypothetical protein [Peptococcaceae bacterium]
MQKGTKIFAILLCLTVLFGIISFSLEVRVGDKAVIADEGIRPAQMTAHDKELLKKFGLDSNNMALLSFAAPKEAKGMMLDTMILRNGEWEPYTFCGGVSLSDADIEEYGRLYGELAIILNTERESQTRLVDERELEFRMMLGSGTLGVTYANLENDGSDEYLAQGIVFLDAKREIVLGEKIPVAMLLSNKESSMPVVSMEHYNAPDERFDMVDEVIAVTVTFI